jgi:rhamnose utilization protein RhaD (predicted bifunctional aldolase and dehydrogenase)
VDEILMTVATALATRAAGALADEGRKALDTFRQAVGRAFSRHPSYEKALANAEAKPGDAERVQALARALGMAAAQDPAFRSALDAFAPTVNIQNTHHDTAVIAQAEASHGGVTVQNVFGTVHGNATVIGSPGAEEHRR